MSDLLPVLRVDSGLRPSHSPAVRYEYNWKTGKGFYLRPREAVVAAAFLETRSYQECARRLKEETGVVRSPLTCQRWLMTEKVREWMQEKMEEAGYCVAWSKGRWLKVMTDHVNEVRRLAPGDLYAMKLIAGVMGYMMPEGGGVVNQSFTFTQADGNV